MKKYLKFLFVALIASSTFAFTACGDDNDEPDGGNNPGGGSLNVSDYNFTVNGEKYYYAIDYSEYFAGVGFPIPAEEMYSLNSKYYISDSSGSIQLSVRGYNRVITSSEQYQRPIPSDITRYASLTNVFLEQFDFNNTPSGTVLKTVDVFTAPMYNNLCVGIANGYIDRFEGGIEVSSERYCWYCYNQRDPANSLYGSNDLGQITFVSYKDERLTLKLQGIRMQIDDEQHYDDPEPKYFEFNGTVVFEKGTL